MSEVKNDRLSAGKTYVAGVHVCVSPLAMHHDYSPLNIGLLQSLAIASKGLVVEEGCGVGSSRVGNAEVGEFSAKYSWKTVRNRLASVLLGQCRSTEERERSECGDRHRDK